MFPSVIPSETPSTKPTTQPTQDPIQIMMPSEIATVSPSLPPSDAPITSAVPTDAPSTNLPTVSPTFQEVQCQSVYLDDTLFPMGYCIIYPSTSPDGNGIKFSCRDDQAHVSIYEDTQCKVLSTIQLVTQ